MYRAIVCLLAVSVAVASCAGPIRRTERAVRPPVEASPEPPAGYEEFDPAPYREEPPPQRPTVVHDAPPELLSGKLGRRIGDTQPGFRIQILSTREKGEADLAASHAVAWWREVRASGALDHLDPDENPTPPVYQDFRPPYYRVRIGNFLSRERAEDMLAFVEERFESAFIAPDRVEGRR